MEDMIIKEELAAPAKQHSEQHPLPAKHQTGCGGLADSQFPLPALSASHSLCWEVADDTDDCTLMEDISPSMWVAWSDMMIK